MKHVVILGKTNVGKTLFALNFAAYLGMASMRMRMQMTAEDNGTQFVAALPAACEEFVSANPHHTKRLQRVVLVAAQGKGRREFELIDTAGLMDSVHPDESVRRGMAQTLGVVRTAEVILHMFDCAVTEQHELVTEVDLHIAEFARLKGGYAILANKMDLPQAEQGLLELKQVMAGIRIIPVSALLSHGFDEVKDYVRRRV